MALPWTPPFFFFRSSHRREEERSRSWCLSPGRNPRQLNEGAEVHGRRPNRHGEFRSCILLDLQRSQTENSTMLRRTIPCSTDSGTSGLKIENCLRNFSSLLLRPSSAGVRRESLWFWEPNVAPVNSWRAPRDLPLLNPPLGCIPRGVAVLHLHPALAWSPEIGVAH